MIPIYDILEKANYGDSRKMWLPGFEGNDGAQGIFRAVGLFCIYTNCGY